MAFYVKNVISSVKMSTVMVSCNRKVIQKKLQTHLALSEAVCKFHTSNIIQKRRKTTEERKSQNKAMQFPPKSKGDVVDVWRGITVGELAKVLDHNVNYVSELFLGNIRGHNAVIEDIKELHNAIRRSGRRMRIVAKPVAAEEKPQEKDARPREPPTKASLKPRPPIVTVMGHVDHGKTTLLDALRHSSVVDQEFGGITQHIGAFSVKLESGAKVTFLDTPGHAAFSAMRARGANLTDIVCLVVAADDGVMEQTIECIKMAKQAKVPILVAINKIDAPKANIERTEQMLMQRGIQVESLGGDVQVVHISALKRVNLDQLTEALVLQAELLEIGSDPSGPVEAVVVDSHIDPHRGRLCTLVVQRGTLRKGAVLLADVAMAKVKQLRDAQGQVLTEVAPGYPVEVEGWKDLPPAGECVLQVESEKRARDVIKYREEQKEMEKLEEDAAAIATKAEQHQKLYNEKLQMKRRLGRYKLRPEGPRRPEIAADDDNPSFSLIVKADVDGTLEAILETLSTYHSSDCEMDIINYGVGAVTENDVDLAKTFKGIIYAFNVECPKRIKQQADEGGVAIKHSNVIYKLVDALKEDINQRLPPKQIEEVLGKAAVLQQFLINEGRKKVPVAGCRCEKGLLKRDSLFRVIRSGQTIHEGPLVSMRYLKSEADTIKMDSDCGLQFANRELMFEVGDTIICYENKMETQTIDWDPGF